MTLLGINWFAIGVAVAVNMVYGHYYYLPKVTAELNKSSEKYGKSNQKKNRPYIYLFVSNLAMAIAIWNLRLMPQFSGKNTILILLWIWLPFFLLPRYATKSIAKGNEKMFSLETNHILLQVIITGLILRLAIG